MIEKNDSIIFVDLKEVSTSSENIQYLYEKSEGGAVRKKTKHI